MAADEQPKIIAAGGTHRAQDIISAGLVLIAAVISLMLVWYVTSALFLIFAGILFGFFLNALTNLLAFTRLGHAVRLSLVCITLVVVLSGAVTVGGQTVARETALLASTLRTEVTNIRNWLEQRGVDTGLLGFGNIPTQGESAAQPAQQSHQTQQRNFSLPSGTSAVLGQTVQIVFGTVSAVGNFFIIIFLGVMIAAQPALYRDGLIRMVPPRRRDDARAFVTDIGDTMHRWLLGQLLTMTVILVVVWLGLLLLGIPGAFILGFQAGLLAFIPTVGAIVSGAIIILASLSSGWVAVIGAAVLYLGVQTLESYLLTPMIQRRAIDIPPATIFGAQIMFGFLFGLWGLALALPLIVISRVALDHFYLSPQAR